MITQLYDKDSIEKAISTNIPYTKSSIFFKWEQEGAIMYSAVNQRGDVLECHVSAIDRKSKVKLRTAINQMCQFLFMTFPCANRIVSYSFKNSMKNMAKRCGFKLVATVDDDKAEGGKFEILMRYR